MGSSVVCPGSFDPITLGHLDIVKRAAARFDRVVVAVLDNPSKQGLFTVDERIALIAEVTAEIDRVEVDRFSGLLVDYCHANDIDLVCKGLRSANDFEYELRMAQMNRHLGQVETIFVPTAPEHAYLSSSLVKEVARLGGPLAGTVPAAVEAALRARVRSTTGG